MEHPYLYLVKIFEMFGAGPAQFAHQWPHVIYTWAVMLFLLVVGAIAAKSVKLIPGKAQNFFEVLIAGMEDFMVEFTGEEGRWLFPLVGTIFIFVFASNLSGLMPGVYPPTASINTTLAMAIIVVVFTHVIGVKYHGAGYIKHFLGPVWWMIPIILPIEIIAHLARLLSLSIRLFGNMAGHELVLGILFALAGAFLAPLPIMAMGILVALVQAFVFFLLTIIYFSSAMEHAH